MKKLFKGFFNETTEFEKHSNHTSRMLEKEINIYIAQFNQRNNTPSLDIGDKIKHGKRKFKSIQLHYLGSQTHFG